MRKLFAEPMAERAAFAGRAPAPAGHGEIVSAFVGGALYQRFEMMLPKGSKVSRLASNQIRIAMPRFTLDLEVRCDGMNINLPRSYLRHLCDLDPADTRIFRVCVGLYDCAAALRLLRPSRWSYYKWIDAWLAKIEREVSAERYLEDIGYEMAETAFRMIRGDRFTRWDSRGEESGGHIERIDS
jgi:hypothetical protein